ncbi:hypothetical protein AVEN_124476-1 [Araneus ventricosus]|uniref:Uncharacterized protein n=1 Tax=Araneus ventricosus TaxID=182803 RepID=A0A4Y2KRQ1_ARAVE|nr:hypothetical protein AVEN_124476-1 [Araneus ventricosus]
MEGVALRPRETPVAPQTGPSHHKWSQQTTCLTGRDDVHYGLVDVRVNIKCDQELALLGRLVCPTKCSVGVRPGSRRSMVVQEPTD